MCGVAGIVDFEGPPSGALLRRMGESLARRGPDANGAWSDGACGLAHRRLSIIDVAGSPQPMSAPGANITLTYNGELYNYRQLRGELLQDGVSFATQGDTEVVLRCLAADWAGALTRLDGMFALGAWDRAEQRLLLARDPIGEKPLYYAAPRAGLLVFGSEPKAVLCHPEVERRADPGALRQMLRFRTVYGQACLHAGIVQLPAGCYLDFSRRGLRLGRFFDLAQDLAAGRRRLAAMTDLAIVAEGRERFIKSVAGRLVADVPVGAFLSGGLDSSLVTAAMRELRGGAAEIRTYSVGFEGDLATELPFAAEVADRVGSKHTAITVGPQAFLDHLADLSGCRDGPVSEPADVAVAVMSRVARESVRVVLSGEGADEIFGGYPKYGMAAVGGWLGPPMRWLGGARTARLAGLAGLSASRVEVAARALAQPTELERISQWFSYLDREDLAGLFPGLGWDDEAWASTMAPQADAMAAAAAEGSGPLETMQLVDCLTWLPGNMLARGDRMTMAEGLEMRPPFLDRDLVRFGLALPPRLKVRGRVSKWIARQWGADMLPATIASRRKWGFRVPLGDWFRGPLRELLHDYLGSRGGLVATFGDDRAVKALLRQHDAGSADVSASLWGLLSAEVWFQDVYLPTLGAAGSASPPIHAHAPVCG